MLRQSLLIYGKEMMIMRRDRRLTIGVTVTSFIIMPALMGFLGRVTQNAQPASGPTHVLVIGEAPIVNRVIASDSLLTASPTDNVDSPTQRVVVSVGNSSLLIQADATNPQLWEAARRIATGVAELQREDLRSRIIQLGGSASDVRPVDTRVVDISSAGSRGALVMGALVPYLAIVLLVANAIRAIYVAVGEKEKNTLASLLVTQVPREAIVLGKSLAISTFAVIASVLLVAGMVLFANLGFSVAGESFGAVRFSLDASQTAELVLNIIGLALIISSAIMVVGTYARTQREAGVYTAPLLFLSIFLAVFSFSGAAVSPIGYAIPILGNAVAMKTTIVTGTSFPMAGLTLAVNMVVFLLLIWISVAMYRRENILFRR